MRLKKKWCVLRYPNPAMAQVAERSTEDFADFYFDVCRLDYAKMSRAMDPLAALIETHRPGPPQGPGHRPAASPSRACRPVKCDGDRNIPDGEVYTAPVRDSVNGVIRYNAKTRAGRRGARTSGSTCKDGRIVDADLRRRRSRS